MTATKKPFKEQVLATSIAINAFFGLVVVAMAAGFLLTHVGVDVQVKDGAVVVCTETCDDNVAAETEPKNAEPGSVEDRAVVVCTRVWCSGNAVTEGEPKAEPIPTKKATSPTKSEAEPTTPAVEPTEPSVPASKPRRATNRMVADAGEELNLSWYPSQRPDMGSAYHDCPRDSSCGQAMGLAGQWGAAAIGGGLYAYGQKLRRPDVNKFNVRANARSHSSSHSASSSKGGGGQGPRGPRGPEGPPGDGPPDSDGPVHGNNPPPDSDGGGPNHGNNP